MNKSKLHYVDTADHNYVLKKYVVFDEFDLTTDFVGVNMSDKQLQER